MGSASAIKAKLANMSWDEKTRCHFERTCRAIAHWREEKSYTPCIFDMYFVKDFSFAASRNPRPHALSK